MPRRDQLSRIAFADSLRGFFDNISVTNKNNNITIKFKIMSNTKLNEAISKLSKKELKEIFPPITRKNFVVRKSWYGRGQIITFVNNKKEKVTYNHDEVLKVMLPKLSIMPCWLKRGYWSQSTAMPSNVRDVVLERVELA